MSYGNWFLSDAFFYYWDYNGHGEGQFFAKNTMVLLIHFSRYESFLGIWSYLGQKLSKFLSFPRILYEPYCHIECMHCLDSLLLFIMARDSHKINLRFQKAKCPAWLACTKINWVLDIENWQLQNKKWENNHHRNCFH